MGLGSDDRIPSDISMADAYSKIRQWYQSNVQQAIELGNDYGRRSAALINALPATSATTDLEKRAIFQEVISNLLEWGYHKSDGEYKMAADARGGAKAAGSDWSLSEGERKELRKSRLWPYLTSSVQ